MTGGGCREAAALGEGKNLFDSSGDSGFLLLRIVEEKREENME